MSKVSVIVPVYNTEKYIRRCINSILKQTYNNIEIIIVNDGSTDKSQDIINELKEQHSNIKTMIQKNSRQGTARNNGISMSTGDYIVFVDSDDYLLEDSIETLMNTIEDKNIAVGNMLQESSEGITQVKYIDDILKKAKRLKLTNLKNLYDSAFLSSSCHKLINKNFIIKNEIKFPEKMVWEDGPFNLNIWLESDEIKYTVKNVYCRTIREDENNKSTMQTINRNIIEDDIKSYNLSMNLCDKYNNQRLKCTLIKNFYRTNLNRINQLNQNDDKLVLLNKINKFKNQWLDDLKSKISIYEYLYVKLRTEQIKLKFKSKIG